MKTIPAFKQNTRYAFVILLAIIPVISTGALNVREISLINLLRPMIVLSFIALVVWQLSYCILKDRERAAIFSSTFIFLFFNYGHFLFALLYLLYRDTLYQIDAKDLWFINLPLLLTIILIPIIAQRFAGKSNTINKILISSLNVLGIVMISQSVYTMAAYSIQFDKAPGVKENDFNGSSPARPPDVYYIILDAYTRADTLLDAGFDNSDFIKKLEQRGFFVAHCSTSNYKFTTLSLSSTLNIDYVWNILPDESENNAISLALDKSIKQNRVREIFSSMGYQILAFQTGYAWTEWRDADLYLESGYNPFLAPNFQPLERSLIYMSAFKPILEHRLLNFGLGDIFSYQAHAAGVEYTLTTLATIPKIDGPKFVFAHMLVPHPPYIFNQDGTLNQDSAFFDLPNSLSSNEQLNLIGYFNNIRFINTRILLTIDTILADSENPPIIILQGDHGRWNSKGDDKFTILNAYYFPEGGDKSLYPRITPVNSFRVLLNKYFGTDYPLLEDWTILTQNDHPYKSQQTPPIPSPCD